DPRGDRGPRAAPRAPARRRGRLGRGARRARHDACRGRRRPARRLRARRPRVPLVLLRAVRQQAAVRHLAPVRAHLRRAPADHERRGHRPRSVVRLPRRDPRDDACRPRGRSRGGGAGAPSRSPYAHGAGPRPHLDPDRRRATRMTTTPHLLPALVTAFGPDGALDLGSCRRLFAWAATLDVEAHFVAGTTGEFVTLSDDERLSVIAVAVDEIGP